MIDKQNFISFLKDLQWEETHALFHKEHPHLRIDYRSECNDFTLGFRWGSSYASFRVLNPLTTSLEDIPDIYKSYIHQCASTNTSLLALKTLLEECNEVLYRLGCVYKWDAATWKTREGMHFQLRSYENVVNLVWIKGENFSEEISIKEPTDLYHVIYPDNYTFAQ